MVPAAAWPLTCGEAWCAGLQEFKSTAKGSGQKAVRAVGDIWLHALAVTLLAATAASGVWQLAAGAPPLSPLLISVLWAVRAASSGARTRGLPPATRAC